jgi:thioester reductase-like protein
MGGVFITGATGYLGSYVVHDLLTMSDRPLTLMVRARDDAQALDRVWGALSWHQSPDAFRAFRPRLRVVRGDLHAPDLGLSPADRAGILDGVDSVLHIAASLNRRSNVACANTNLRGSLAVIKLARALADRGQLERFSQVSTSAVAGVRQSEVVLDDETVDWDRSDYDPYARTKKFAETMATELLPDVRRLIFRPTTVMGDSRTDRTWQTDMTRAFVALARMPVVPLDPDLRLDFVPADWVSRCIATLHLAPEPQHEQYNLGAGLGSTTGRRIAAAMAEGGGPRLRFAESLGKPFDWGVRLMARTPKGQPLRPVGSIMKVFWPYITYDTVFANERVVAEVGAKPAPFEAYCAGMLRWSLAHGQENPPPPPTPVDA